MSSRDHQVGIDHVTVVPRPTPVDERNADDAAEED